MVKYDRFGSSFGTTAKELYLELCDKYVWDKSQAGKFGEQKNSYAEMTVAGKPIAVWIILYSNLNPPPPKKKSKWTNKVEIEKGIITQTYNSGTPMFSKRIGNRVIFARQQDKRYIFAGVYERKEIKGNVEIFAETSDRYP